jgi:hypothetical protein
MFRCFALNYESDTYVFLPRFSLQSQSIKYSNEYSVQKGGQNVRCLQRLWLPLCTFQKTL